MVGPSTGVKKDKRKKGSGGTQKRRSAACAQKNLINREVLSSTVLSSYAWEPIKNHWRKKKKKKSAVKFFRTEGSQSDKFFIWHFSSPIVFTIVSVQCTEALSDF